MVMLIFSPIRHAARGQGVVCVEDDGSGARPVLCRGDLHWLQRRQGLHGPAAPLLRRAETVTSQTRTHGTASHKVSDRCTAHIHDRLGFTPLIGDRGGQALQDASQGGLPDESVQSPNQKFGPGHMPLDRPGGWAGRGRRAAYGFRRLTYRHLLKLMA